MIKIENLTFQYKKKTPLYSDFSLNLKEGHIVGLLGKNGAGKSTLLGMIAGLLSPQSGTLIANGYKPWERKPVFLSDIYMVPEEFHFPSITISCYTKAYAPLYPSFDLEKLDAICGEFELKSSSNLNQLSHGQRKKFLIAFALASNCKILLLDEPTNGLDIPSKSQFRKILVSSVTDEQLVLISTHQVKDIDTIIDKIVVVDNGTMIYEEETVEITQKVYFDTVASLAGIDDILYQESCPSGYRIMTKALPNKESSIDLELLFNAIINHSI